jgi:hypothetical protein
MAAPLVGLAARLAAKRAGKKVKKILNPADKNQLKILKDTVRNPNKSLLGGPSEREAIQMLKQKFGFNENSIKKLQK